MGFVVSFILLVGAVSLLGGCAPAQPTPPPATWPSYWNRWYGYEIRYPPDGSVVENIGGSTTVVYLLARQQAFATSDHMVLLTATHPGAGCVIPGMRDKPETRPSRIRIGAVEFVGYSGQVGAPPVVTIWEPYATEREGTCVVITYSVRVPAPVQVGDSRVAAAEDEARRQFDGILASFAWAESE